MPRQLKGTLYGEEVHDAEWKNIVLELDLGDLSVQEGIRRERALLAPIRDRADVVIDTSLMDPQQHRQRLLQEFLGDVENGMSLILSSFGFKYGVPQDSNYVLDVRLLPNPFYVPELKPLTGTDPAVQE